MKTRRKNLIRGLIFSLAAAVALVNFSAQATAQIAGFGGQRFEVNESVDQLSIIAGSARRLKFEYKVPQIMVENPEVIQASAISPNEILVTGLKPGVSTITVSDPDENLQTIAVEVIVDTRKLEMAFANYFPDSQVKVHPLQTGVILAGHVARADQVSNIMAVARDYFPTNVVNQLQVNGNQNIAIKVKIFEVSRTKLRQLGIDWSYLGREFSAVTSISNLIQAVSADDGVSSNLGTMNYGVVSNGRSFNAFIDALEKNDVAKLLDQPVLVAQNGRPAEFLSGGEIPIQVAVGLGATSIEFRAFGTKLDMVPIVHGNGELTLEVRAEVSEVAPELGTASGIPGFNVRRVNTGVKMKAGHTLALAGDFREDSQSSNAGIPKLRDSPYFGNFFRRTTETKNETELVFLITPRFISDVEPNQLPRLGPGQLTTNPSNHEFYINGHLEVPRCNDDCPINDEFNRGQSMGQGFQGQPMGQMNQQSPPVMSNGYPAIPTQPAAYQGGYETSSSMYPVNNESSRRSAPAAQTRQANSGFLWPTNSSSR